MRAGCAYFGVRVPRHAARDMDELAALGYTAALDCAWGADPHWRGGGGWRWAACRARGGAEASLVDFLGEMVAHVRDRGGRNTVCLLPVPGDWDAVAALPGLDVLATDPYWNC